MSGRRRSYWVDDNGSPHETWDPILSSDDGFENYMISHIDAEQKKRQFVAILSPAERHVLLMLIRGESPGRSHKDTLMRLRQKAATMWA